MVEASQAVDTAKVESSVKRNEQGQVILSVSGILNDLQSGLTREDIRTKYELSKQAMTEIFKNPKLKGKKTRVKKIEFVLEDDTVEDTVEDPTGDAPEMGNHIASSEAAPEVVGMAIQEEEVTDNVIEEENTQEELREEN